MPSLGSCLNILKAWDESLSPLLTALSSLLQSSFPYVSHPATYYSRHITSMSAGNFTQHSWLCVHVTSPCSLFLSFFFSFLSAAGNSMGAETITNTRGLCLWAAGGTYGGLPWELCCCVCFWSCFSLFSFVLGWRGIACLVTIQYIESISKWVDPEDFPQPHWDGRFLTKCPSWCQDTTAEHPRGGWGTAKDTLPEKKRSGVMRRSTCGQMQKSGQIFYLYVILLWIFIFCTFI